MADAPVALHVFKFVALRPPTPPSERSADLSFTRDARPAKETPVGRFVAQFDAANVATLPQKLREFIESQHYDAGYPQSEGDMRLDAVEAAWLAVPAAQLSTERLAAAARDVLGVPPKDHLADQATRAQRSALWDRYHAFSIGQGFGLGNVDRLTRNLRIYHVLDLLARDVPIASAATRDAALAATPVVDALFTSLPRPAPAAAPPPAPDRARTEAYQRLWSELVDTYRARDDVRGLRRTAEVKTHTERVTQPNRATGIADSANVMRADTVSRVDAASVAAMRPQTRTVLATVRADLGSLQPAQTVGAITRRLQQLNAQVAMIGDPEFFRMMPMEAKGIPGLGILPELQKDEALTFLPPALFENVLESIKPLGIGDLKVVKQKLKAYVAGEVAHIENVLRGEHKERRHRVLDRTEETLTLETETEEETSRDTQTTERFELKKESERAIQEQMSVQAGVTVSGSYGMVTFGAYGDFAYSTAAQQSEKSAANFAREVVDKAVSRVQKRVREERVSKRLHEVEELNTHGIDNRGEPAHVTGIYRWVDKRYEAQIYNYGRRLMFEFIVPEPAAFYQYARDNKPRKALVPPKPLPATLTHKDVTEDNYQNFIRDYQVQGVVPPPPEFKLIGMSLSSDAKIENGTALAKTSKDLAVPEGYQLVESAASVSLLYQNHPQFKLSVGADQLIVWLSNATAMQRYDAVAGGTTEPFDSLVPVSIAAYDINSYFVNVQATCQRRWEKYEAWQIQTFEKVLAAYKTLQAEYEQKLAAQETQAGVAIQGNNPLINREIERNELKRACVQLLMDTWTYGSFNAMKQPKDQAPDADIKDAVQEGRTIQFFEQAFEWENLTYLFYPYFWGRRSQWVPKLTTSDPDPLFMKFLQAGSARVVLPVRPGYNDTVMYFLEHGGTIWSGGDTPRLDDPLYMSLADELRNQTDDLAGAKPEGDPWEVVLPTTLVYLQEDATLPTFP